MKTVKSYTMLGVEVAVVFQSTDNFVVTVNGKVVTEGMTYHEASQKFNDAVVQLNMGGLC